MKKTKKRVINNLKIAFGNRFNEKEREKICRGLLCEIILNFFELLMMTKISEKEFEKLFICEGEEKIKESLKKKKGIVGVCSHLGNFPLMQVYLWRKGYPVNMIVRDSNNIYLARYGRKLREKIGIPSISKWNLKKAIEESRKWLREGGILCFYLDQHAGNGVKAEFFGRKVFVPVGAAVFARKFQSEILGFFSYRLPSGKHKIVIEGPYPLIKTSNLSEDIKKMTSYFIKRVENYVEKYPEQWFSWLHRRFR